MSSCSAPIVEPRTKDGLLTWLCALLDGERVTFRGEVYRVVSGILFRERGDGSLLNAPELSIQVLINAVSSTQEPFCPEASPPRTAPDDMEVAMLVAEARQRANSWTMPRSVAQKVFRDAYTGAQVGEKTAAQVDQMLHQAVWISLGYYPSAVEVRAVVNAAFARYEATRG